MNKRKENPILAAEWRLSLDTEIKQTFGVVFLQKSTRFQFMKRKKCFHRKDFGVSPKRCVKWGANTCMRCPILLTIPISIQRWTLGAFVAIFMRKFLNTIYFIIQSKKL